MEIQKSAFVLLLASFSWALTSNAESTVSQDTAQWVTDSHLHFVDFLQHHEDINSLIAAMNKAHVKDAMVNGLPLIKKWGDKDGIRPSYYLDNDSKLYYYGLSDIIVAKEIKKLPPNEQTRLHPFICSFNPTDKNSIDHIKNMMDWYPHFWQGIGEVITRHGAMTDLTEGETATANNPALDEIYNYAAKNKLPILIHSDISTPWVPQDSPSANEPIYLNEIDDIVGKHPKTTFIWAHGGLDRDIKVNKIVSVIDEELSKHANMYIDISGFTYPYIIQDGIVDKDWITLIKKYPDRIMLGTDAVGHFSDYSNKIDPFRTIMAALPKDVATKISTTNFLKLLPTR
jgi:hypothetical protein